MSFKPSKDHGVFPYHIMIAVRAIRVKTGLSLTLAMICLAGFKVPVQKAGLIFWNCSAQGKQIIVKVNPRYSI
jgi:hypothetical protein